MRDTLAADGSLTVAKRENQPTRKPKWLSKSANNCPPGSIRAPYLANNLLCSLRHALQDSLQNVLINQISLRFLSPLFFQYENPSGNCPTGFQSGTEFVVACFFSFLSFLSFVLYYPFFFWQFLDVGKFCNFFKFLFIPFLSNYFKCLPCIPRLFPTFFWCLFFSHFLHSSL